MRKKIYFIVRHISQQKFMRLKKTISTQANEHVVEFEILKSTYSGHALKLTRKAIEEKADAVVACGGDGTINEIARVLVDKQIPLGIIPIGSGNGIAGHFCIPSNLSDATNIIFNGYSTKIDLGFFDEKYFLGNLGFGIESTFIKNYNKKGLHGFFAYCIAFFKAINSFSYPKLKIEWQENKMEVEPLMLLFSNLNQQGYNFTLTPYANSNDGNLDMVYIEKSNIFQVLKFLIFIIQGKEIKSKEVHRLQFSKMKITNLKEESIEYEIDGEFFKTHKKSLEIRVFSKKLSLIVPDS